ncbi:glycosyltransferase [Anabaena sp. CS-542/02]|uniref:glycosyltransferase n=1 Tax=Anabaena sp. CS-542/02 TaxID=3021719 RepID=UPI00232E876A|nr:glycosyltransferase [Anabaena sp. CS-542/02]MDB9446462.1 glycosyltransferase [Anabaena sp. CS-542/02]
MIFLYSDVLYRAGGIETYLHALATHLHQEKIPFCVVVAELESCPLVDELVKIGIHVYRQPRVWGDRWLVRQRLMLAWLGTQLKPGDWVYCVRQPMPQLYLNMVRLVHQRGARIAASWMLAPEFLPPLSPHGQKFCEAVAETDAVISVSQCTVDQFKQIYGYTGKVHVVPYHNLLLFPEIVSLPPSPPWKIGFLGRLDIKQKNLDTLLQAIATLVNNQKPVELHLYGRGADQPQLEKLAEELGITQQVIFHGAYDHRQDLPKIMANCHLFVYPSRFEGGPCFTLLELMQAGRFCVAAKVGGIPDLYEGYPEIGLLVSPDHPEELNQALTIALEKVANGSIDSEKIRARYFSGFDMQSGHRAWTAVINTNSQ